MRIEIYLANLHIGGSLVVADCLLRGLVSNLNRGVDDSVEWHFVLSSEIYGRLAPELRSNLASIGRLHVRNDRPTTAMFHRRKRPDFRFTLFGPAYIRRSARFEVSGFADGSLIFVPDSSMRIRQRILKIFKLHRLRGYDIILVQTHRLKAALGLLTGFNDVRVVRSGLHPAFEHVSNYGKALQREGSFDGGVVLLYPARAYPHKRHDLLPKICEELQERLQQNIECRVTLSELEFKALGFQNFSFISNLGVLSAEDLAQAYLAADVVVFPSENETHSFVPLEAQYLQRPVVAADLPFMKEYEPVGLFLFSPGSVPSAVSAVLEALEWAESPTPTPLPERNSSCTHFAWSILTLGWHEAPTQRTGDTPA